MTAKDWLCVHCRRNHAQGHPEGLCVDCLRHRAYGVIIANAIGNGHGYDVLDALATLMGTVTRLRRAHNKEMADEQREAARGALDSYASGRIDGRSEGRQ